MDIQFRQAEVSGDVVALMALVPELQASPPEEIAKRTAGNDPLLLVAETPDGAPVGFKLGYALSPRVFYSWIGGVVPQCRREGIARTLLEMQEHIVRERGYETIRVKSMNKYPAMLIFLISRGYAITGMEEGGDSAKKIVFEKRVR